MRRLCLSLLCILLMVPLRAQWAAPGVLVASGLAVHYLGHDAIELPLRNYVQMDLRDGGTLPYHDIGSYVQYVPSAMHLSLGLAGCRARMPFMDRVVESSIAHLSALCLSRIPKYIFHSQRPDGGDFKSFPSGHSILAFTGAELTRMDYGNWWGAGAYAMSVFVGLDRIYGDRHWLGDVLAGAGLGILSAHIGACLAGPVKNWLGPPEFNWDGAGSRKVQLTVAAVSDPVSGTICPALSLAF